MAGRELASRKRRKVISLLLSVVHTNLFYKLEHMYYLLFLRVYESSLFPSPSKAFAALDKAFWYEYGL
jgi:hypothetical protein